jgi:hypothetical protein
MTEFTDYAEFSSLRLETLKANNIWLKLRAKT